MSVVDIISREKNVISVEIEPPKVGKSIDEVFAILDPLVALGARWIDITYHAANIVAYAAGHPVLETMKPGTVGIAGAIRERYGKQGAFPLPHVICTSFTKDDTQCYLTELNFLGINNILLLQGDAVKDLTRPKGEQRLPWKQTPGGHAFALELIAQVVGLGRGEYLNGVNGDPMKFNIGAACYPEGHTSSAEVELPFIKEKMNAGAGYLVTQMFFDNAIYYRYRGMTESEGIHAPLIPGIQPLFSYQHLSVLPQAFKCSFPSDLIQAVEKHKDNQTDIKKVGIEWSARQIEDLRRNGAPSVHLYAFRGAPVREVMEMLL